MFFVTDIENPSVFQQQGGIGPAETEFDFDGYSMDNIPV